ncbi:hypothetical protein F2Q70_00025045 [Brassica cretica]|uniref:Reverse transcriptase zinc-binding domain-containing protein n=1 Tax=Brassica cretica TaxID=69181 RepID=A0A8S9L896_BRACR|nr:hypothetical protein F2Q70_00025045 [Brassica cretica]
MFGTPPLWTALWLLLPLMAGRASWQVEKFCDWAVGNGEKIRVWQDPWLSCEAPLVPIGPPTLSSSNLLVKDQVAWLFEKSGSYSTRSGYGAGMDRERAASFIPIPFDWKKSIWNVQTAPKIKDFLWKLVKKAIPVSANLASRGITSFPCKTCDGVEDDLHTFLLCSVAKEVWDMAPITWTHPPLSSSMMVFVSSCSNVKNLPPTGVSVPLWPWILWNLWKAPNKRCFEDKVYSSMEVLIKSIKDAREWQDAQALATVTSKEYHGSLQKESYLQQSPPFPNTVTCHVDAAWDTGSNNCGLGGVFSGHSSKKTQTVRFYGT